MPALNANAITVTVPVYTMTLVCPLCHQPMDFKTGEVNICPHCGKAFLVTATQPQPGPTETKC